MISFLRHRLLGEATTKCTEGKLVSVYFFFRTPFVAGCRLIFVDRFTNFHSPPAPPLVLKVEIEKLDCTI
jgi:hypothetical protein